MTQLANEHATRVRGSALRPYRGFRYRLAFEAGRFTAEIIDPAGESRPLPVQFDLQESCEREAKLFIDRKIEREKA